MKYKLLAAALLVCLAACSGGGLPPTVSNAISTPPQPSCSQFSHFVTEAELFTYGVGNLPVKVTPPSGMKFTWVSLNSKLYTSPVNIISKDSTYQSVEPQGSFTWTPEPPLTFVKLQQALANFDNGTGVEVDATVCT